MELRLDLPDTWPNLKSTLVTPVPLTPVTLVPFQDSLDLVTLVQVLLTVTQSAGTP